MNDFLGIAQLVNDFIALVEEVVQVSDDRAEVLASGNGAPSADGMKAHSHRAFRQERGRVVRLYRVGMINSEHEERCAIRGVLTVLAGAGSGGEFVGTEDVFGAEVARSAAVDAGEESWHLRGCKSRQAGDDGMAVGPQRLAKCSADVTAHGIVARHGLVGAFQHDDVLLARQRVDDRGFREGANDIEMDGANRRAAVLAEVIDRSLDVFSRRTQRHEYRVSIFSPVTGHQAVMATSELGELYIGGLEEGQNGFSEVVAARRHTLHVVFLVLHRPEQNGIGEIDHARYAAALRPK